MTKPIIPKTIRSSYEAIESEKAKLAVAVQTQKLVEKEAETERKRALIEAEKAKAVEAVELERALKQRENERQLGAIQNEMVAARAKADADAELYRASKEAEANRIRLTPELLQLEAVRALANNTKVFWGDRLPSLYIDGVAGLLNGGEAGAARDETRG